MSARGPSAQLVQRMVLRAGTEGQRRAQEAHEHEKET